MSIMRRFLAFLVAVDMAAFLVAPGTAFVAFQGRAAVRPLATGAPTTSSVTLHAKKAKRRRRKKSADASSSSEPMSPAAPASGEESIMSGGADSLPDFDLGASGTDSIQSSPASSSSSSSSSSSTPSAAAKAATTTKPSSGVIIGENEITPTMMGSADAPVKSVKELLNDRSLERKFQFVNDATEAAAAADDEDELPDLLNMSAEQRISAPTQDGGSSAELPVGKRARNEARRAAAIARDQQAEDENGGFDVLEGIASISPFSVKSEKNDEIMPTKLLELGAWLGIGLLVLWEVYINSPLFERAEPLVPILPPPGGGM